MIKPELVALLFADKVIVEENNKKKTIIGTFTKFFADKFPISFPVWYIYTAVTNISGEHSFSLKLVYKEKKQIIIPINGKLQVSDPKSVIELIFPITKAVFPAPGEYILTFTINGTQVGSRLLDISQLEQQNTGDAVK